MNLRIGRDRGGLRPGNRLYVSFNGISRGKVENSTRMMSGG